jgi:hypothetical protein
MRHEGETATTAQPFNKLHAEEGLSLAGAPMHAGTGSGLQGFEVQLVSAEALTHYDVNLSLKLACDASYYGNGAVIVHVLP